MTGIQALFFWLGSLKRVGGSVDSQLASKIIIVIYIFNAEHSTVTKYNYVQRNMNITSQRNKDKNLQQKIKIQTATKKTNPYQEKVVFVNFIPGVRLFCSFIRCCYFDVLYSVKHFGLALVFAVRNE